MDIRVRKKTTRVYTGGRAPDEDAPAVLLIHGAGQDHSVWNHQARHLAHHGFRCFAPDLPGHGGSAGKALRGIDAMADWALELLDALGCARAGLAGHSMGSLIALAAAAKAPDRVTHLVLIGSVAPMPVAPVLIEAATGDRDRAHAMINQWSFSVGAQLGASATPGVALVGLNRRLMERQGDGVLAADLKACNAWTDGLVCAAQVSCPSLLICGERDQMTPPRAARPLCEALVKVPGGARMMTLPGAGHAMMAESPGPLNKAMRRFLEDDKN